MAGFRPLHDRVLVKRIEAEEKTAGGIIIPDTAKEKPAEGEVLALGPGTRDETGKLQPLEVKSGDRILFGKWSGREVILKWRRSADHEGIRYIGGVRNSAAIISFGGSRSRTICVALSLSTTSRLVSSPPVSST
jgi:chaperonin GroES